MLTVLALVAIAAGMLICAGNLVSLWIASRRQDNEDSTHVERLTFFVEGDNQ